MGRSQRFETLFLTLLALSFCLPVPAGHAGLFDKVKEVKDKVPEKPGERPGGSDRGQGWLRQDVRRFHQV